jgi:hypothetical protein
MVLGMLDKLMVHRPDRVEVLINYGCNAALSINNIAA